MSFEIAIVGAVLLLTFAALISEWLSADAILMGALTAVTVFGIIDIERALSGFANPTLVALASLYIVSVALRNSGALARAGPIFLGKLKNLRAVLARLSVSVSAFSAFLNNTPVVAMGIPTVQTWAKEHGFSASKILIPLSYASIIGGVCTLIGTSTNLVVDGLMRAEGLSGLGFFELAGVGLPCAVVGCLYIVFICPSLLEDRPAPIEAERQERREVLGITVQPDSPLIGQTVEEAGIRTFPELHLIRINRGQKTISPISRDVVLAAHDQLFYLPDADKEIVEPDLSEYPGLEIIEEVEQALRQAERQTHQVVVREGSPLIRRKVKETDFLERFNALVTGVRRRGKHLRGPVEQITLQAGDSIFLDTGRGFHRAFQDAPEFYIVSGVGGIGNEPEKREPIDVQPTNVFISIAVLLGIVGSAVAGLAHISLAALVGAIILIGMNIVSAAEARRAIDWEVLLVIGAALGLAEAIDVSGLAGLTGSVIADLGAVFGPMGLLTAVVLGTMLLTELITNNGAVALFFPVVVSIAQTDGLDPRPFIIGMTVAGSLSMATPLGYQTNLMVYSAGNYRFSDFIKAGVPLQLLLAVIIIATVPMVWSF